MVNLDKTMIDAQSGLEATFVGRLGAGRLVFQLGSVPALIETTVTPSGEIRGVEGCHIINKPEPKQVWYMNVYAAEGEGVRYPTREAADMGRCLSRIACIKVTEGQFDD